MAYPKLWEPILTESSSTEEVGGQSVKNQKQ